MKGAFNNGGELLKSPSLLKILILIFLSITFFYIGKHWSDVGTQQLLFFTSSSYSLSSHSVSLSPNLNKNFDVLSLINSTSPPSADLHDLVQRPPPPEKKVVEEPVKRFGIVDENGTMTDDFEIGEFDPNVVENWGNSSDSEVAESENKVKIRVSRFPICDESFREYIPCMDNEDAIKRLVSTEKGEKFERHCPEKGKELNCLVPAPKNYKTPIPWPKSRDEVMIFFFLVS